MPLNSTEEIIEEIRQGRMVILMDDEDRENEGDLIMAASMVKDSDINFMARYGRGLVCLTLSPERCEQLKLPLMVSDTNDKHGTNFTVSIEAAEGVTTGISAADRAVTVQAAVAPDAKPGDVVSPGHIFPLRAQPGGVLTRAGHTEAGCDLARLAGLEPAATIVEILNEDGTMARRDDLEKFAAEHGIKIGTVADLIHYRIENEKTAERIGVSEVSNEFGAFRMYSYLDATDDTVHIALVWGEIDTSEPVLVRVHVQDCLCDLIGGLEDCGMPLRKAMEYIVKRDSGVIIVLRKPASTSDLVRRLRNYQLRGKGVNLPVEPPGEDLRGYGLGAQILLDLGIHKMRVLSSPKKMHGLSGFNLEVTEYVGFDD